MPKLVSITFMHCPPLPGLRPSDMQTIKCDDPAGALRGFKLKLKGALATMISPPNWASGKPLTGDITEAYRAGGPQRIFEFARQSLCLQWEGSEDEIAKISDFTSKPFGFVEPIAEDKKEPKSLLDQVPGGLNLKPHEQGDV